MFLKTNIPEITPSLTGAMVDFRDRMSDRLILNDLANKLQAVPVLGVTGNRCGHVPNDPRFYHRPENHKRRPTVLEKAIAALASAYRWPKKFLKKLLGLNKSSRRKRSERREAQASVSQVLLHYLDLITLRVGFYSASGEFIPLDLEFIAEKAGVNVGRAKRAIADLAKVGYIKLSRQFTKQDDGTFKGSPSIREISVQFFIDLGIDIQKLFFARDWKRKQQENAADKKNKKKMRGMLQAAASLGGKVSASFKKVYHRSYKQADKNLISNALELHKANPERSPSDYLKELQRLKE